MLTHRLIDINIDMIFLETNSGEIIHCSVINDVPNTIPNPESSTIPLIDEYICTKDGDIYSAYEYDENHQLHKVEMTLKSNPRFFRRARSQSWNNTRSQSRSRPNQTFLKMPGTHY